MEKVTCLPDLCTVRMDGELRESEDFVAILSKQDGDTSISYNTDALTLGIAVKLIAKEFVMRINECTPEEQQEIHDILGDAFVFEETGGAV